MITYSFADIGSDSLYIYLYKCIKNDILQGVLHAGEKLPSKRNLAKNLNISIITVENAYAQLIAEGYIYSIPKKGFFVTAIKRLHNKNEPLLSTENIQLSSDSSNYFADFTSNQTSSEHFPFSIWAKLTRELLTHNQQELLTNPCHREQRPSLEEGRCSWYADNPDKGYRNKYIARRERLAGQKVQPSCREYDASAGAPMGFAQASQGARAIP